MTTRERWIVYPLLFLTLGIVMRDKVWPQSRFTAEHVASDNLTAYHEITAPRIRCSVLDVGKLTCQGIRVPGPKGTDGVRIGVVPGRGGEIELCGPNEKTLVSVGADGDGGSGAVEVFSADGRPQVQLRSLDKNGMVSTVDSDQNVLVMGRLGQELGVFGTGPNVRGPVFVTQPWQVGPGGLPVGPPK